VKIAMPSMLLLSLGLLTGCPIISYGGTCYTSSPNLEVSKTSVRAGEPITLVATSIDLGDKPRCGSLRKTVFRNGRDIIGEDTSAPFILYWKPVPEKDGIQPGFGTFNLGLSAEYVYENPPDVIEPREFTYASQVVNITYTNSQTNLEVKP
jgi:hypothetical protein